MSMFDVQPPAWLQRATQQTPGELGGIAGLAAGGLINALQKTDDKEVETTDETTGEKKMVPTSQTGWLESRKGLKQGLAEARLNIEDPQWKLKAEATKASIYGQVVQNEMQYSKLKESNRELADWQKAYPGAQAWLSATPDQRKTMPVPDSGGSKQLLSAIQKTQQNDQILFYKQDQAETARLRAEGNLFEVKEGIKAVEGLSAESRSRIGPPAGPNGTYTPQQWGIITFERDKAGLPKMGTPTGVITEQERQKGRVIMEEQKQEGRVDLEEQRQAGREAIETQREKGKLTYEEQRQKDRKELLEEASKYKIDLEKVRASLKTDKTGKMVTKGEFVNRQLHGVYTEIMKAGLDEKVVKKSGLSEAELAMRQARDILEKLYDTSTAFKTPEKPVETPTKPETMPAVKPKDAGTNAAPADPLGLFSK